MDLHSLVLRIVVNLIFKIIFERTKIMSKLFKAFRILTAVMTWYDAADDDGKIDTQEAVQLVHLIAHELDVELSIPVPPQPGNIISQDGA